MKHCTKCEKEVEFLYPVQSVKYDEFTYQWCQSCKEKYESDDWIVVKTGSQYSKKELK